LSCSASRVSRAKSISAAGRAQRELAAIRRRFGYHRLLVLMRREGLIMNHKKFRRLYIARNGCKFVGVVGANGHLAPGLR
jgi:transposase InsO family protein